MWSGPVLRETIHIMRGTAGLLATVLLFWHDTQVCREMIPMHREHNPLPMKMTVPGPSERLLLPPQRRQPVRHRSGTTHSDFPSDFPAAYAAVPRRDAKVAHGGKGGTTRLAEAAPHLLRGSRVDGGSERADV